MTEHVLVPSLMMFQLILLDRRKASLFSGHAVIKCLPFDAGQFLSSSMAMMCFLVAIISHLSGYCTYSYLVNFYCLPATGSRQYLSTSLRPSVF